MKSETGSVLVYILVVVALLAALTFSFMRSDSGGSSNMVSSEEIKLSSSDMLEYSRIIKMAVQVMKASGISDDEFCFYSNNMKSEEYKIDVCEKEEHMLFSQGGGAVNFRHVDSKWLDENHSTKMYYGDYIFTDDVSVKKVGTDDNGGVSKELILIIPYVKDDICKKINEKLAIPSGSIMKDEFEGGFENEDLIYGSNNEFYSDSDGAVIGNEVEILEGKKVGCAVNENGQYYFYNVLISR